MIFYLFILKIRIKLLYLLIIQWYENLDRFNYIYIYYSFKMEEEFSKTIFSDNYYLVALFA